MAPLARVRVALEHARTRSRLLDHALRMQQHYGRVNAGSQAGAVTYFAFLSFFPILALAFFVVGFIARYYPDAQSNLVGKGDLRAQTVQVFENIKVALQSVGADFDDVAKLTTFVVNLKPADRTMIAEVIARYFPPGRRPAHTLVGIDALAVEDLLIEIEAIAVVAD